MSSLTVPLTAVTVVTRCSHHTCRDTRMIIELQAEADSFTSCTSLFPSLKAEVTEVFLGTFNGLLFNFSVLIHFYGFASCLRNPHSLHRNHFCPFYAVSEAACCGPLHTASRTWCIFEYEWRSLGFIFLKVFELCWSLKEMWGSAQHCLPPSLLETICTQHVCLGFFSLRSFFPGRMKQYLGCLCKLCVSKATQTIQSAPSLSSHRKHNIEFRFSALQMCFFLFLFSFSVFLNLD